MNANRLEIVLTDVNWPTLRARLSHEYCVLHVDELNAAEDWRSARAIVTGGVKALDRALLDELPQLGLIAVPAAGYSAVDLDYAVKRDIAVTRCAGINHGDVADVAIGFMIDLVRGLSRCDELVRGGHWRVGAVRPTRSLGALRAGIVGLGGIGRAVADRLEAFGCAVSWYGPRAKPDVALPRSDSLVSLARWSDVLFVCLAPDANAPPPIDASVISALGPEGVLINVSRGFAVDEDALIAALRRGEIGGAGLDVFAQEPTPAQRWADVPNVLLTPHIGGVTRESLQRILDLTLENLRRFYAGEALLGRVDSGAASA